MIRFLVKASIPNDAGNAMVSNPNFSKLVDQIMGDLKPEATYFAVTGGQRTVYLVVNVQDTSEIPRIVEPLWLGFKADVELIPAMDQADFGKAAAHIEQAVKTYNS